MEINYIEVLSWLVSLDPDTIVQDRKVGGISGGCVITTYAKTVDPSVDHTAYGHVFKAPGTAEADLIGKTDDVTKEFMNIFDDAGPVLRAKDALEILAGYIIHA